MALIKCKECGKDISNEVKQCPHCGSTKHRSFFKKHPIVTAILGLMVLGAISNSFVDKSKIQEQQRQEEKRKQEAVQKELESQKIEVKETPKEEPKQEVVQESKSVENWKYDIDEDKMRGTKKVYAGIESSNTLDLGFPYNDSRLTIIVRKLDKETNVILKVKGQFACNSYSEKCMVSVKSDDNAIVKYEFSEAEHSMMDTVFINKEKDFIDMLKKSNKLIVEVPLFNKGRVQYEFNSAGLKWEE